MSRVILKMRFNHPNIKGTKKNNMFHLLYIGTREGVALNDDIKEIENQSSNDTDYLKYMANRPRSHGLFGNEKNVDIQKTANEMKEYQGYVYRGIVSLREEDAVGLGYDQKENWERLIRDRMYYISKQLEIPFSQLRWVGAFHRESGHPHIHMMIWNKGEEIRSLGVIPKQNLENIRKNLTNEIFKTERDQILLEKNSLRELLLEGAKGVHTGDLSKSYELEQKYKEIDVDLMSEAEEMNEYDIGKKVENKLIEKIKTLIDELQVPKTGRLQYKLIPPKVKSEINKITDEILKTSSYATYYEKYLKSVVKLTKLYTDNPEDIEKAKENAKEDIYSRIGNGILKTKKGMMIEEKQHNSNFKGNTSNYSVQSLLMNVFKVLSIKTNRNENTRQLFSKNKAQRKEMAKKMKAKGLYSDRDLDNQI